MYTVNWLPSAERELATLWNTASDRSAIAATADAIDNALARNPLAVGESRKENTRIAFEPPLVVVFDVNEAARHVVVWDVWRWPN
ncbi:hypothetical protein BH10PLA2_BH10PLA2_08280 [soil metagenome]